MRELREPRNGGTPIDHPHLRLKDNCRPTSPRLVGTTLGVEECGVAIKGGRQKATFHPALDAVGVGLAAGLWEQAA